MNLIVITNYSAKVRPVGALRSGIEREGRAIGSKVGDGISVGHLSQLEGYFRVHETRLNSHS